MPGGTSSVSAAPNHLGLLAMTAEQVQAALALTDFASGVTQPAPAASVAPDDADEIRPIEDG